MRPQAATVFELPDSLSATGPPESRGIARDDVRLLVATASGVTHVQFRDLGDFLEPPDVLVVNNSATVPAAIQGVRPDGRHVAVHLSSPLADATYLVELRCDDGSCRIRDGRSGERIAVEGGSVRLASAYPDASTQAGSRIWRAVLDLPTDLPSYLQRHGRPITYGYVGDTWPLRDYQTVFAREPGSAEMPSAARPFSDRLVARLVATGIDIVPITLHTGVSSLEADETPLSERFEVSDAAARRINHARGAGGRVIAVGTTATRAIESAARDDGSVRAAQGWTDLVIGPGRGVRMVDGIVTGWHEPQASHLLLLEAVAGRRIVGRAYEAALAERYLWHEFGDSALLLP
ncbi:S-adenosylmethionine:tRNA ribosyltransferase-isomerase [Solicola gregarius]|uniref:S-adenosylmethionine:tRNA ribosyltransferase-isomerase n=1 Tax=Solicola gregarius TaxID=2908642 RepID=A0AA46TKJ5_9ACTN|nr:S-adenosylmethionine:tRNA ribosyltransferase-isomerase [Solicola gregarius]UYM06604.1 S-adenosylmethionine:tRNA ribosyltransferase-isomerase [Solicola gregarius]